MDATMRMALLIDADNAPAAKIDVILAELARHGVANVRRAYGNWKSVHLQKWEQKWESRRVFQITGTFGCSQWRRLSGHEPKSGE